MTFTGGRPRRCWWRWTLRVFLVVLVGAGLLVGYYAHRRSEAVASVRAAVAELDRTEPGWRFQEIEAARVVIPKDQNSAPVVRKVIGLLPPNWPSLDVVDRLNGLQPQERLDEAGVASLRAELANVQPALREARKLAILPNGRYPPINPRDPAALANLEVIHARKVITLLQYDVLAQAYNGDYNGALRSCRAMLNAGRSVGDEPLAISQLVRSVSVGILSKLGERVLNQGEADADELLALQRLLEDEERFPRLVVTVRGERAWMHEVADAVESGEMPLSELVEGPPPWWQWFGEMEALDMLRAAHPTLLALHSEGVRLAALPAHERLGPMKALEAKWRSQPGILRGLYPAVAVFDKWGRRTDGQLRCLITALAVERYRRQHEHFPDTLDQLVPAFLAAVPIDPLDGKMLGYQHRDDRVVVYSRCGVTSPDLGIDTYNPDEPSPPGVGIAVHLFDVKHRRQPPPELLPPPAIDDDEKDPL